MYLPSPDSAIESPTAIADRDRMRLSRDHPSKPNMRCLACLQVRFTDTPEEKQRKAVRKQRFAGDAAWRGAAGSMPAGFTAFDSVDGQQVGLREHCWQDACCMVGGER